MNCARFDVYKHPDQVSLTSSQKCDLYYVYKLKVNDEQQTQILCSHGQARKKNQVELIDAPQTPLSHKKSKCNYLKLLKTTDTIV